MVSEFVHSCTVTATMGCVATPPEMMGPSMEVAPTNVSLRDAVIEPGGSGMLIACVFFNRPINIKLVYIFL